MGSNMQKLPVSYMWISVLFYTAAHGQPQNTPEDHIIGNKNIFRYLARTETVNDFVYFVGTQSNDEGYTLGNFFAVRIPQVTKNRYFDIAITSKLYTKQAGARYKDARGLTIKPQYFNEISFLSVSYNKYNPDKKLFFCTQVGAGIYNQQEPIPPLSLFLQGGIDGKTGFHELLGPKQERQDNISAGEIRPNFYLQFSIKKFYFFNEKRHKDASYISMEQGSRLVFPLLQGSQLFFNMHSVLPIVRPKSTHTIKIRLAALGNIQLTAHSDGLLLVPEIGMELDIFFLKLGYTNMLILGQQQDSYIGYSDDDPMMRIYVQISF